MCSIDPDNLEPQEGLMPRVLVLHRSTTKCNKCKEETPCVLLRNKDAYCKNCFLTGAVHKFKVLLGKTKLVRPNDKVLVLYKIGHASTAILHLLRSGMDLNSSKRIMFQPVVIFVDEEEHLELSKKREILDAIKKQVDSFNFKLYYISFAQYVKKENNIEIIIQNTDNTVSIQEENTMDFLKEKISETWKNDIKNIKLTQMLVEVAKKLNCKFVFTPEISSDTASELLTNISLGRGTNISVITGFCDNRDENIKILRPMRLFDMKELVYYNTFNHIEPIAFIGPKENPYSSVQNLTKRFVNDLQINYPATVTTILKTGDKLSVASNSDGKCRLCKGSLENNNTRLSSSESTKLSHLLSTHNSDANCDISQQDRYNGMVQSFTNLGKSENKYCFACSKIADYIY